MSTLDEIAVKRVSPSGTPLTARELMTKQNLKQDDSAKLLRGKCIQDLYPSINIEKYESCLTTDLLRCIKNTRVVSNNLQEAHEAAYMATTICARASREMSIHQRESLDETSLRNLSLRDFTTRQARVPPQRPRKNSAALNAFSGQSNLFIILIA